MKRIYSALFFFFMLSFFGFLPVCLKKLTCGFKPSKIFFSYPKDEKWDVCGEEDISSIVSQKFTYLDRGAQCYVFASEDGKYVLKLFRSDSPLFHRNQNKAIRHKKLEKLFTACTLAYTRAKEETGLLYIHLNETEGKLPELELEGPLKTRYRIPLDQTRFAIQKRVCSFRESFISSYKASDANGMKERIDSFVSVIRSRINKGIRNADPTVSRNFGFLGTQAVEIDFGNYTEEIGSRDWEMARYTYRLYAWLLDYAPEWADYLKSSLKDSECTELQSHPHLKEKER